MSSYRQHSIVLLVLISCGLLGCEQRIPLAGKEMQKEKPGSGKVVQPPAHAANTAVSEQARVMAQQPLVSAAEAQVAVETYLEAVIVDFFTAEEQKQQGQLLLRQVEQLKKQEKAAYRSAWRLLTCDSDLSKEGADLLFVQAALHQENSSLLRQLRSQLKDICLLTHAELAACGIRVKPHLVEGVEIGNTSDSSDQEAVYSRADISLRRGALQGIAKAIQAAPIFFLINLINLLDNPSGTIESLVKLLAHLPELSEAIIACAESLEMDEEDKAEAIAQLITAQLLSVATPSKLKSKAKSLSKIKKAVAIIVKERDKIDKEKSKAEKAAKKEHKKKESKK